MRARQRELAHAGDSVLEGRDIGSVVCPDAEVKVWLVADPVVRARRRGAERPETSSDETLTGLRLRDELDAGQMQPAPDAQIVDSTSLDVDDVVAVIARMVEEARLA
jgi:cytidylate kinase